LSWQIRYSGLPWPEIVVVTWQFIPEICTMLD
jgi:hypothetical protein